MVLKLAQTTGPIFITFAQNLYFRPEYMHESEMQSEMKMFNPCYFFTRLYDLYLLITQTKLREPYEKIDKPKKGLNICAMLLSTHFITNFKINE